MYVRMFYDSMIMGPLKVDKKKTHEKYKLIYILDKTKKSNNSGDVWCCCST